MAKSVIVNFHKVDDPIWFEKEIVSIKSKYNLLSIEALETLLYSGKKFKNVCHITFDDGDRTFYDIAFPILKKHQVSVSHFVSPNAISLEQNFWFQESEGYDQSILKEIIIETLKLDPKKVEALSPNILLKCLNIDQIHQILDTYRTNTDTPIKPPQNMSVEQLKEVDNSGLVTIGGHTQHHPILRNESDESSLTEIKDSIIGLEKLLGHPIKYFAYPNGLPVLDFGQREINSLQEHNIRLAFSTDSRHLGQEKDLFSLPRMGLSPRNPANAIKLRLGAKWETIRGFFGKSAIDLRNIAYQLLS